MTTGTNTPTQARRNRMAMIALLLVASVWGSSFPLTKSLLDSMSAVNFLAIRYTLAGLLMMLLFAKAVRALHRHELTRGVILGAGYALASILQVVGLEHTSASVSGFVTGMYVVLTPICAAVLLRSHISSRAWIGAIVATIGLGVLALKGVSLGYGEWITLLSALGFALHILGLGVWSTPQKAIGLAAVQLATVGVVCLAAAVIVDPGGLTLPQGGGDWAAMLFMVVVSGAFAMIVQSWAQAHLNSSRAALVMSSEPVWAAFFAIAFFSEPLTWRVLAGGGLMLAAMLIVELGGSPPPAHVTPP